MQWRSIGLVLLLSLSPASALQAHEAHRNNEPDPVAQSTEHNVADEGMPSMQS